MSDAVTVVIPTYRRSDLLAKCMESVRPQAKSIIIVDDSGDKAFGDALERDYPDAIIVHNETNRGFAYSANRGIEAASTDCVMLLNDDMVLAPDCIEKLVAHMAEGIGGVGPLILNGDGTEIYAAGDRLRIDGRPESIGFREPRDDFDFNETPFGITAGAALYTREFLVAMNGFDEKYIAYFEDADLCARGRLAGYSFALIEDAIAYHEGSASIEGRTWWRTRQCMRNHLLLVKICFPALTAFGNWPALCREAMHHAARTFNAVRCERGAIAGAWELLKVYGELTALAPHIVAKRYRALYKRKISRRDFEAPLHRDGS